MGKGTQKEEMIQKRFGGMKENWIGVQEGGYACVSSSKAALL